jgi:hypothetical protein
MLKYLAMVSTHQLNLFPAKGGVSAYLSPHVILKGSNLDFEKHCQVPFGAYVQANQENDPTNTLAPRTIDAIYLHPMTSIQGGHEMMNLQTGKVITQNTVWKRPVTDLVIRAIEAMAKEQGIKTLKLTGRNKIVIYPINWIAGVEYDQNDENNDNDTDEEYRNVEPIYEFEDKLDDDKAYDRIEQDEIDELLAEPGQDDNNANPTDNQVQQYEVQQNDQQEIAVIEDDETVDAASSRPTRERTEPERLTYFQNEKHVRFEDEDWHRLERSHNLFTQVKSNPDQDRTYEPQMAMVIAQLIGDIQSKEATIQGASKLYATVYFPMRTQEVRTMRSRCSIQRIKSATQEKLFTPIDVASMTPEEMKKAVDALMFLGEKRDKSGKAWMVYNGKPTRKWLSREDLTSPTAALESIMLTVIVDAKEGRDVMTADIPNAFIQTKLPKIKGSREQVIVKITGVLVDLLVDMAPELYGPFPMS